MPLGSAPAAHARPRAPPPGAERDQEHRQTNTVSATTFAWTNSITESMGSARHSPSSRIMVSQNLDHDEHHQVHAVAMGIPAHSMAP
jgi:hypothetical protein